jgi:hypothetical protein
MQARQAKQVKTMQGLRHMRTEERGEWALTLES